MHRETQGEASTNFKHFDVVYPSIDFSKFKPSIDGVVKTDNEEIISGDHEVVRGDHHDKLVGGDHDSEKYITMMSRPVKGKGIDIFCRMAEMMPEYKFLFCGGDISEFVERTEPEIFCNPRRLTPNLFCENFTNHPEKIYQQSHIIIIPSESETFSMVAIEASLCGVPVLCRNIPEIYEATSGLANYVDAKYTGERNEVELWVNECRKVLSQSDSNTIGVNTIFQEYMEKREGQIARFLFNIENLLENRSICPYTRNLKFSIHISMYNSANMAETAIESVFNQTMKYRNMFDVEIIVVDDASKDKSFQHIKDKYKDDHRVKVYQNKENRGTFYCRNLGIQKASGDYILNLDSDDLLSNTALSLLAEKIWQTNSMIVQFQYYRDRLNLVQKIGDLNKIDLTEYLVKKKTEHQIDQDISYGLFCINRNYLMKKLGYYHCVQYVADTEMMCRIKKFHSYCNLENEIIYYARDREGSLSKRIDKEWSNNYMRQVYQKYNECIKSGNMNLVFHSFDSNMKD